MRAVIIGNGDIADYEYIKSRLSQEDFIICADGGIRHTVGLGVKPNIVIGDFDSAAGSEGVEKCVYPTDKDFTDGELAVSYAMENGYDEILMIAMTGKRLDHTLTNIFQLTRRSGISLVDENNEIFAVWDTLKICNRKEKTLSVIPVFGDLTGVTITGMKYPLNNETLYFAEGRGNSNVITEDECTISVKSGIGIVLINNGE